jgi:hypothetical protein
VSFLRQQFLQDGNLPFTDVPSAEVASQVLGAIGACWNDRIFTPLVTLWVFLGQVLNADPSCRAAVARLIAHRVSQGLRPCSSRLALNSQSVPLHLFSENRRENRVSVVAHCDEIDRHVVQFE